MIWTIIIALACLLVGFVAGWWLAYHVGHGDGLIGSRPKPWPWQ